MPSAPNASYGRTCRKLSRVDLIVGYNPPVMFLNALDPCLGLRNTCRRHCDVFSHLESTLALSPRLCLPHLRPGSRSRLGRHHAALDRTSGLRRGSSSARCWIPSSASGLVWILEKDNVPVKPMKLVHNFIFFLHAEG